MNTRDHRPGHLPKVLAALLVLCVLVSAVAYAPGWMRAQSPQRSIAATLTPQIDPAVEPVAVLAMAAPMEPTTVSRARASGNSISHGFDADVAAEYMLAASYESAEEQHEPVAADSSIEEMDGGHPIRLAAVRSSALAGGARGISGARSAAGGAGSSSGVAAGGKAPSENSPGTDQPAADGSPSDATKSAAEAPAQSAPGNAPSSGPPPSSIGDGVPPDAEPPSKGSSPTPDPTPPVHQTPIDLPQIESPVQRPVSVPEPASLGLLLLGLAGIAGARRRRAKV